jgi:cytochrome c peroxidase
MRPAACLALLIVSAAVASAIGSDTGRGPTPLGLDEYFFTPDDNPLTADKIELGRRLFFDRRLSTDGRVSCASCHRPERAFSGGVSRSNGVHGRRGTRNAPALINRAYGRAFSWDGRTTSLEEQVLRPFQRSDEMDLTPDAVDARLRADADYRELFQRTFGGPPTVDDVSRALASFVRAQRFGNTPFDRYQAGDAEALSPEATRGFALFRSRANCSTCHLSPTFTDEAFHNTGVSWGAGDLGRFRVTGKDADRGAFKTPTLREVARTSPYMHDGSLPTLNVVVEFYSRGGRRNPFLDKEIKPLALGDGERRDLVAFLVSLGSAADPGRAGR